MQRALYIDPQRCYRIACAFYFVEGCQMYHCIHALAYRAQCLWPSQVAVPYLKSLDPGGQFCWYLAHQQPKSIVWPLAQVLYKSSADVAQPASHQHFHRCFNAQSYGMDGSNGSLRLISSGSWGNVAQLATIATVVPIPLKPFHTNGGIVTRQ